MKIKIWARSANKDCWKSEHFSYVFTIKFVYLYSQLYQLETLLKIQEEKFKIEKYIFQLILTLAFDLMRKFLSSSKNSFLNILKRLRNHTSKLFAFQQDAQKIASLIFNSEITRRNIVHFNKIISLKNV